MAVSVLTLLTLAACGTESGSGSGDGTVRNAPPVTGVRWSVESVIVGGKRSDAPADAPADAHVEIDSRGRASGSYGCNRFTADVRIDGDALTFGPGTTTEMGCEKDIQRFEALMSRAFNGRLTAAVAAKKLTLTTAKGDTVALTSRPAAPLAGTDWRVTTLVSGSSASSVPAGTQGSARIAFGRNGTVHGTLGCNSFRGQAHVSGSTAAFGPLVTTRKMCPDPGMRLESALLEVIDGKRTTYAVDDRTLSLTAQGGGGKGLAAVAAAKKPD
ncbi:META domain-containing protein [Streptomyces sp. NPDC058221]|uniref:META domain-containing protein n=1 Tax=Streptomyces sp. NPDC058221 TaxID=3346388 RepID=UPI0036E9DEBF